MAATIEIGATTIASALTSASVKSTQDPRIVGTSTGYGPPIVIILGDGSADMTALGRVGMLYRYRLTCIGATLENSRTSLTALRTLTATVLGAMRDLAGYAVISLGPESEGDYAGGKYLAADIIVATYISI